MLIRSLRFFTFRGALESAITMSEDGRVRRFKHVFLDAEGTLYVPKNGQSRWAFWYRPSPKEAVEFFELDRGVVETLTKLRSEVDTLCVVSLNSEPVLDAILDTFDIRRFFDEVMVNGDKGKRISRYLEERGLDRTEAVMVGDTPVLDLYPVQKAGIHSVLVDRDYNRWAKAERIKGVWELPAWLRMADIAEDMNRKRVRIARLDEFISTTHDQSAVGTKRLIATAGA